MTQARHKEGSSHSYSTTEETDLQSNDACQNCVSLVKKIVDFVEKYGIQKLKEVMTQEVCKTLPNPMRALCEKTLEKSIDKLIKWIEDQMSPKQICQMIRVCPSEDADVAEFIELLTLIQAEFE